MSTRVNYFGVVGELTSLPGCSQVAVSHGVFAPVSERGKGNGTRANLERQKLARGLGYDLMLCTVDEGNTAQRKVLERTGWHQLTSFRSAKTEHILEIWCCVPKLTEAI